LQRTCPSFVCKTSSTTSAFPAFSSSQLTRPQTELLDQYSDDAAVSDASALHTNELGLANATFAWSKERATDGALTPSRQVFRLRIEEPLVFKRGAINLIVGPTGCGKSSLLLALLGEMHYIPSGPGAWVNLPRQGGIAYWWASRACVCVLVG
jgi:ABC-type multidrug transport system fused ATPase/permease subunit